MSTMIHTFCVNSSLIFYEFTSGKAFIKRPENPGIPVSSAQQYAAKEAGKKLHNGGFSAKIRTCVRSISDQLEMFTPVLHVRDVDLSLAFYTRVLGFEGEGGLPDLDGKTVYAEAYLGDAKIMLTRRRAESRPFSSSVYGIELYLTLPETLDIHQFWAALKARDVHIVDDLHEELWGDHAFTVADPDGYRLIIAQPMHYAASLPLAEKHIA